jgi:hypothetical protein
MMIGTLEFARNALHVFRPFDSGRCQSSNTKSGGLAAAALRAGRLRRRPQASPARFSEGWRRSPTAGSVPPPSPSYGFWRSCE